MHADCDDLMELKLVIILVNHTMRGYITIVYVFISITKVFFIQSTKLMFPCICSDTVSGIVITSMTVQNYNLNIAVILG